MAVFSKILLSGSTSGKPIKIGAVATPGTLIHTAVAGATSFDEVWIWLSNLDVASRNVTIEWGGATDPDDLAAKALVLPASSGPTLVVSKLVMNGGLIIKIFASVADVITATGFVNRIS